MKISVTSEIGTLKRLLVHSPDSGLGKVVPSKAQDWLFEDIVHLDTIRKNEYDYYTKILLYFLDPDKIKGKLAAIDDTAANRNFYKPEEKDFFKSDKVIELQWLLAEILTDQNTKSKLVASVCAIEGCSYQLQKTLMNYNSTDLATSSAPVLFSPGLQPNPAQVKLQP
jgi:arginine deiminase